MFGNNQGYFNPQNGTGSYVAAKSVWAHSESSVVYNIAVCQLENKTPSFLLICEMNEENSVTKNGKVPSKVRVSTESRPIFLAAWRTQHFCITSRNI